MKYRTQSLGTTWRLFRRNTEHAVAIQILVKGSLQRFQRRAGSRQVVIGCEVAVAVGIPDRKQIGAGVLKSNLVAARRLLHADRCLRSELSRNNGHPAIFQTPGICQPLHILSPSLPHQSAHSRRAHPPQTDAPPYFSCGPGPVPMLSR